MAPQEDRVERMTDQLDIACRRLRAYLRLLLDDEDEADDTLLAFLNHLIENGAPPVDFAAMLRAFHRWMPPQRADGRKAGGSEAERLLGWSLCGFTLRERAVILLSNLPEIRTAELHRILGLAPDQVSAILRDAMRRMDDVSVIIVAPHSAAAQAIAGAMQELGIRRIRLIARLAELRGMVAAQRPSLVVADLESGLAVEALRSTLRRPLGRSAARFPRSSWPPATPWKARASRSASRSAPARCNGRCWPRSGPEGTRMVAARSGCGLR